MLGGQEVEVVGRSKLSNWSYMSELSVADKDGLNMLVDLLLYLILEAKAAADGGCLQELGRLNPYLKLGLV